MVAEPHRLPSLRRARVVAIRCRKQLGQGILHGRCRTRRRYSGRRTCSIGTMRQFARISIVAFVGRWYRVGIGCVVVGQDQVRGTNPHRCRLARLSLISVCVARLAQGGIPRPNALDLFDLPVTESVGRCRRTVQLYPLDA